MSKKEKICSDWQIREAFAPAPHFKLLAVGRSTERQCEYPTMGTGQWVPDNGYRRVPDHLYHNDAAGAVNHPRQC